MFKQCEHIEYGIKHFKISGDCRRFSEFSLYSGAPIDLI